MSLSIGDHVPELTATQDNGRPYTIDAGRWQVLFFFPKTATIHCQLQARRYQAMAADFQALGVDLVGINGDARQEQAVFRDLCKLDYPLLNDRAQHLSAAFGVLDEPWPGEDVRRPRRETFLVGPDGVITDHWRDVSAGEDAATVLARIQERLRLTLA